MKYITKCVCVFLPAWIEPSERSNTARLLVGLGGGDDLAIAGGKIECMDDDEYFICLLL